MVKNDSQLVLSFFFLVWLTNLNYSGSCFSLETTLSIQMETNSANGLSKGKAKEETVAFLIELEKQRAIKVGTKFAFSLTEIYNFLKIEDLH